MTRDLFRRLGRLESIKGRSAEDRAGLAALACHLDQLAAAKASGNPDAQREILALVGALEGGVQ